LRFFIEAGITFGLSFAVLTGLLYLTTRGRFSDDWPDLFIVWVGIAGALLGLAVLSRLSRDEYKARGPVWPSTRSWLIGGLTAFVVWTFLYTTLTTGYGGPAYPWDIVLGGIRLSIRAAWAALTGQSTSQDLFPF
jgi:hypothetical protein